MNKTTIAIILYYYHREIYGSHLADKLFREATS